MKSLSVRLHGYPVGVLQKEAYAGYSFRYLPDWDKTAKQHRLPRDLSISIPFSDTVYEELAQSFFANLLPESTGVRRQLAGRFQIGASDDFGLLSELGRELPGAVTVSDMDARVVPDGTSPPDYTPMDAETLGRHLSELKSRPLLVDADGEVRLSLAGMHDKAALLKVSNQFALPHNETPSSHIIKLDIDRLPNSARVEHFCLRLAGLLGISVPRSSIDVTPTGQSFMAIQRYDRIIAIDGSGDRRLLRVHQEDFCQALGFGPESKYEKDGGPGWKNIFAMVRRMEAPATALDDMLKRAVFQYLVGNPDAHAKNYAVLHKPHGSTLSPLYDVNNAAAFRSFFKETRPRLAMSIGGERNPELLTDNHWFEFGQEVGIHWRKVTTVLTDMASQMREKVVMLREETAGTIADTDLLDITVEDIVQRCDYVLQDQMQHVRRK